MFKLQPSSAGKLMEILPTVPIGGSLLVEREALKVFLERVAAADDVPALLTEIRRDKATRSRRKLRHVTRFDVEPVPMAALPEWIRFSRGRMEVDFATVEQLVEGMFMLAGILHNELDAFAATYETPSEERQANIAAGQEMRAMFDGLRKMEMEHRREADLVAKRPIARHQMDTTEIEAAEALCL